MSGENCVGKLATRSFDVDECEGGYDVKKFILLVCNNEGNFLKSTEISGVNNLLLITPCTNCESLFPSEKGLTYRHHLLLGTYY